MLPYVFLVYYCKEQNNNNKLLHSSVVFYRLIELSLCLMRVIKDGNI